MSPCPEESPLYRRENEAQNNLEPFPRHRTGKWQSRGATQVSFLVPQLLDSESVPAPPVNLDLRGAKGKK
jgi:hypothetical protein